MELGFVVFLVLLALLVSVAHYVAIDWFCRVSRRSTSSKKKWLLSFGFSFAALLARGLSSRMTGDFAREVATVFAIEGLVLLLAMIPLWAIGLVFRRASGAPSRLGGARFVALRPSDSEEGAEPTSRLAHKPDTASAKGSAERTGHLGRREILEGALGAGTLASIGGTIGWGAIRGRYDYQIEEVIVKIAGLPKALEGYTIAQISDVHVGTFIQERELRGGFEFVRRTKPDLVVATGDLIDVDGAIAPLFAREFEDLASSARDGGAVIFGNHDYYAGIARVRDAIRATRVRLLENEAMHVRPNDGGGFALLGVDDLHGLRGGRGPRLDRAIAAAPPDAARILLSHQPSSVDLWAGRVALQLSGHTHGGQVNPGFRPADLVMRYVSGRYEVGGTTLWVNRGFGVAGPPTRVMAPPEVTKIVLVSA